MSETGRSLAILALSALLCGCGDDEGGTDRADAAVTSDADVTDGTVDDAGTDDALADDATSADALMCTAGAFIECADSDTATVCNSAGDGTVAQGCGGFGCNATEMRCNECTPSTTVCDSDDAVVCDADGIAARTTCALGCDANDVPPACFVLQPSNLPATACATTGTADMAISANETIDTGNAANCDLVVPQTGAPDICVKIANDITIAAGVTVTITGTRAAALVAVGTLTLDGVIDASASGATSGPGAPLAAGNGGDAHLLGSAEASWGGGGGGGQTVGEAGSSNVTLGAGGAGGAITGTAELSPLVPGSRGGRNGVVSGDPRTAAGGGGGGAVQLVGCEGISIGATGGINAGAGGGRGGPGSTSLASAGGGGGGGSGGGILLEAASITLASGATLAANGGGGGGGGLRGSGPATVGPAGGPGDDADFGSTAASGGAGPVESGDGGAGGALASAPTGGAAPTAAAGSAGGGGGAAGRIRMNVPTGTTPTDLGAIVSPAATTGAVQAD